MTDSKSLEKAVGRLLVGRLPGKVLDQEFKTLLSDGTAGGICIFKDNVESLEQLCELVENINSNSCFNPIICVDQEGGAVQRFDDVLTPLPSLMALAATGNEKLAEMAAVVNGKQLRALGVNCVLSPVIDVASNPLNPIIGTRAFSSDPETVTRFAKAMLEAFLQEGVVPVVKHYPGHGDTGQDSHSELAVIDRSKQSIENLELVPFKNCAQISPALLAAHVWLKAYEEKPLPATLSSRLLKDVLRKELGFDGLVFTDDMMMKAVSDHYGLSESALLAIEAGCDVVLLCSTASALKEAHQHIVDAVKSGRLPEERITEANSRIDRLFPLAGKPRLDHQSRIDLIKGWFEDDDARISMIYYHSIALLQGKEPNMSELPNAIVVPNHPRYPLPLAQYLKFHLDADQSHDIEEVRYSLNPQKGEIDKLVSTLRGKNLVVVTFRAGLNQGQMELAAQLEKAAANFLGIAADIPYDCKAVSEAATYLCTFDPSNKAMDALAMMLANRQVPVGKFPVALEQRQTSS